MSIGPVLDGEVAHRSSLIVRSNGHGSLIGLIIDGLSSHEPLSFLSKSLENMVWAYLHNGDLLVEAGFFTGGGSARLVLSNLGVATSWDYVWLEGHELGVLHVGVAEGTVLVTEGLTLSIWVPVVMGLVMSMVLIEGVVQVTINPAELRNMTKEEWHLGVLAWLVVVSLSNWVDGLVEVRVDDLVSKVIVPLLGEVLGGSRGIEICQRHFFNKVFY